jgi:hypothetical protein
MKFHYKKHILPTRPPKSPWKVIEKLFQIFFEVVDKLFFEQLVILLVRARPTD